MRIESITISGFRCFGPNEISIPISDEVTTIVGPNAAGKTALLQAMSKLFGVTRTQRTILLSDFHLGTKEDPESRDSKELYIEALIAFPELLDGSATVETIAPSFRHMQILRAGQGPSAECGLKHNGTTMARLRERFHRISFGSIAWIKSPQRTNTSLWL